MKFVWIVATLALAVGCGRGIDKSKGGAPSNNSPANNGASNNTASNGSTSNNAASNNVSSSNSSSNNSVTNGPECGDGILDPGELCDPGIGDGNGACPTSCQAPACSTASLSGSPSTCDARCVTEPVACTDGDGCCPAGCDLSTDEDCSNTCGDGIVDGPETCDGNCPSNCNDGDLCTTDSLTGSAAMCSAECAYDAITACVNDDGCCPTGCDGSDTDCGPIETCGNGTVDAGELCDGNCPSSCNDSHSCTTDRLEGSAANCDAQCSYTEITACTSGDGCCPNGCTYDMDTDCPCSPMTCAQAGAECGTVDDGCGNTVTCTDTCQPDEMCNSQNACVAEEDFIGEPCTDYPDCGTHPDRACIIPPAWPDGYCTIICTNASGVCPSSSHCVAFDGTDSVCLLDCTSDAQCATGYECRNWDGTGGRECVPPEPEPGGGQAGDACGSDADCDAAYTCETTLNGVNGGTYPAPGGVCTTTCLPLLGTCPDGSICALDGYCMGTCLTDLDCRQGYSCLIGLPGVSGNYCWPS